MPRVRSVRRYRTNPNASYETTPYWNDPQRADESPEAIREEAREELAWLAEQARLERQREGLAAAEGEIER